MIMVIFAKEKDGYAKYQHMTVIPQDICGIDIHPSSKSMDLSCSISRPRRKEKILKLREISSE
jgi:hypothetical protein